MKDVKRWRGLNALISDVVGQGASAVERVHLATARRSFAILEQLPGVRVPAQELHEVHDAVVSGVYGTVRAVNQLAGKTLDAVLEALDEGEPRDAGES